MSDNEGNAGEADERAFKRETRAGGRVAGGPWRKPKKKKGEEVELTDVVFYFEF